MPKTLNLIGGGRVAKTLGRLWHDRHTLEIGHILTRSRETAEETAKFIGAGHAIDAKDELRPAGLWLIATTDDAVSGVACTLAATGVIRKDDLVFHCSGALSSAALEPVAGEGASIASAHPMHSFADPLASQAGFAGSFCAMEGDPAAIASLADLFHDIGARCITIDPSKKSLYHAASVIASNCLVALIETSLKVFEQAGISREQSAALIAPIMHATADNTLQRGASDALTGPVSRGEVDLLRSQLTELGNVDTNTAEVYRALGLAAVTIARQQNKPEIAEKLLRIEALFKT